MAEDGDVGFTTKRVRRKADPDAANVDRIRNGEWREVLGEVGSTEYNRLRLIALK